MFSLILATFERSEELKVFFNSLLNQTFKQFEIIVADQNEDDRLTNVIQNYKDRLEIVHIRTPKGLSRSRNEALKYAQGDFVAFPDDDCQYTDDLLYNVFNFFQDQKDFAGISVRWANSLNNGLKPMPSLSSRRITKSNIVGLVCSISLFFRRNIFQHIGPFENNMGLGSGTIFVGAEDYEFSLRAIHNNHLLYFKSEWLVLHPLQNSEGAITPNKKKRLIGDGAAKYLLCKRYLGMSLFYKSLIKHFLGVFYNFFKRNKVGYIGHRYKLQGMLLGKKQYKVLFNNEGVHQ